MATVTFGNTTIWNDAGDGVGRVQVVAEGKVTAWSFEQLPRGDGIVGKNLGTMPGSVQVVVQYVLSSSDYNTLIATLEGLLSTEGTLTVPPGQSFASCVLRQAIRVRNEPLTTPGISGTKYRVTLALVFQRLR